jgi:hypothetical protein
MRFGGIVCYSVVCSGSTFVYVVVQVCAWALVSLSSSCMASLLFGSSSSMRMDIIDLCK